MGKGDSTLGLGQPWLWAEQPAPPALTSTLLKEQLYILLVLLLLQGQLAVHLQALPLQGHLQPIHQPLLLLQLHLQLREGNLLLVLLLSECHHLSQDQPGSASTLVPFPR